MIILNKRIDLNESDSNQNDRFLCRSASRQIRERVARCQRWSWQLCLPGAKLDNRADPLA